MVPRVPELKQWRIQAWLALDEQAVPCIAEREGLTAKTVYRKKGSMAMEESLHDEPRRAALQGEAAGFEEGFGAYLSSAVDTVVRRDARKTLGGSGVLYKTGAPGL